MNTYAVYNIEFTKEQYNVLKFINKYKSVNDNLLKQSFSTDVLRRSVNVLDENQFIERPHVFNPDTGCDDGPADNWHITDKGINACMLVSQHNKDFIKEFLITKASDIVVAFITAFITYFLMPHICDMFFLSWK